jgi:hypothetical protein
MTKIYQEEGKTRTVRISVLAVAYSLMTLLAFSQRPATNPIDAKTIVLCILYLSPMIVFWYLAIYHTYVSVDEVNLKLVKLLFFRTTIPILAIYRLEHEYAMAGFAQRIEVSYRTADEKEKKVVMPMFGYRNTAAILRQLLETNPSIKMDHKVQQLKENQGNGWHGQRDMTP